MFYHVEVLRRHGGKFGTPWLAATSPKSLSKRDYTVFNVTEAANGLRTVVIGEKLGAQDHRTRYSLYLSSQLMFGLVRILKKQIDSILKDVELLVESLHGSNRKLYTMETVSSGGRKGRHLSDQVLSSIDADPNILNIEYGLYDILDPIPPHELPDVSVWNRFDLTDMEEQRGLEEYSQSLSPASFNKHSRLQARSADITLKEPTFESSRDLGILSDDLPMQNEQELTTLMQIGLPEDPLSLELHDKKRDTTPIPFETEPLKEPGRPKKARKDRHKDFSDTTTHTAPQVEKPSIVTHLQLSELDPNEPAQHQRQRRERHLAIDASISLDHRTMSNHMANTEPTLGSKALRVPKFGEKKSEIMFKEPARKSMTGSVLRKLWSSAIIVHVKHLDEQSSESFESGVRNFQDGSVTQLPAYVILEHPSQEELIHLPMEQQREASKLTEDQSLICETLNLPDEPRGNTSSSRSIRASSVRSAQTEPSGQDSTQEIAEPPELKPLNDTPVNIHDDSQSLTVMHIDSIMMKLEACAGETTFEDICPLDTHADVASLMFIALLNGASRGIWEVTQDEAFGKISIHQVLVGAMQLSC